MKEKDLDKNTIVAYHAYLQHRIQNDLNAVGLGPSRVPCYLAAILGIAAAITAIIGCLIISLRYRHVYLVGWNDQFLGPAFVAIALLMAGGATHLLVAAKRRSNRYRRELYFRPIGDFGIGVIHKSTLMHEQQVKSELKSGTTPHKKILPRSEDYSRTSQGRSRSGGQHRPREQGHENRGYDKDRRERRDDGRESRDDGRERRDDGRERRDDGRERRDDGRRPPDDRRRNDDDRRRHDDDRRRHDDERRRQGDDRKPDDDRRRQDDDRRRHEERKRHEDDRRREEHKRSEAEGEGPPPEERRRGRGAPKLSAETPKIILDPDFGMTEGGSASEI